MTPRMRESPAAVREPALDRATVSVGFGRLEDSPVYADQFQIYTGNANRGPCREDLPLPRERARRRPGVRVREREHLRQDHGERPREGRLHRPAHEQPREQVDHGAADHDRRLQARVGRADHRRRAVLRVRPLGQEGPAARPDHGPPRRRHDLASPARTGS